MIVNGVPYPINVKDEETLTEWISSIDRPISSWSKDKIINNLVHLEINVHFYFQSSNIETKELAICNVNQTMANYLFQHLARAPKGELMWRTKPKYDILPVSFPSDLSKIMGREKIDQLILFKGEKKILPLDEAKDLLGLEGWGVDFENDEIFPLVAPIGEWSIYKGYMRYSVHIDGVDTVRTSGLKSGLK